MKHFVSFEKSKFGLQEKCHVTVAWSSVRKRVLWLSRVMNYLINGSFEFRFRQTQQHSIKPPLKHLVIGVAGTVESCCDVTFKVA